MPAPMNILCFADTRFPIERANGVQTMATCHALASRGHTVTLVARADTADPPRDPFAFYDWPPESRLRLEAVRGAEASGSQARAIPAGRAAARGLDPSRASC